MRRGTLRPSRARQPPPAGVPAKTPRRGPFAFPMRDDTGSSRPVKNLNRKFAGISREAGGRGPKAPGILEEEDCRNARRRDEQEPNRAIAIELPRKEHRPLRPDPKRFGRFRGASKHDAHPFLLSRQKSDRRA